MRRFITSAALLGLFAVPAVSLIGCADETKVEEKKTVETPGGKVTETDTKKVEATGDAKPAPAPTP